MKPATWRKALRLARNIIANALSVSNPLRRHRIEAHVLHGWAGASAFAQRMGLSLEGVRRQAGAQGESIEIWAITGPVKG
jgi:hypothetical protein